MSAGGSIGAADSVEIFCPPYLFNANGTPATRPVTSGSPQRVRYGAQFSVCLNSVGTISSACLIRPGATTHSFDQNQRYVPLTVTQDLTLGRLIATAPADSSLAPPGDYLLFVVNSSGVPSIARWVRLGFAWSEGDVTPPDSISLVADFVTNNAVNLTWVASGDDGSAGTAAYTELRRSNSPIVTDAHWAAAIAHRVTPPPVPVCGGLGQSQLVTGLQPHTNYYFAIKTADESGNLSPIGRLKVTTLSECCIGEARARLAHDEEGAPSESHRANAAATANGAGIALPTAVAPTAGGTGLILDATAGTNGFDVRLISIQAGSYDGYLLAANAGVLLQSEEGSGKWATQLHYDLPPGNRFALCTPERATRWVILEPCAVEQVLTAVRGKNAASNLDGARHSRLGDATALLAAGSPPALLPGDTLALHYALVPENEVPRSGWLLVMDKLSGGATMTRAGGRPHENTSVAAVEFALHQNQPNPFAATTTIGFALPTASRVRLEVFDLLGRRVRTLVNAQYPAGEHQVVWDRRTTEGPLARPGLYFYGIEAGPMRGRKKMALLP